MQKQSLGDMKSSKIKGWIARNEDNTLLFYSEKPRYKAPSGCWVVRPCEALKNILWLNEMDFPEITSKSEPLGVELTITPTRNYD